MAEIDIIGNTDYTYIQVASAIADRIKAGQITSQLPAERDLAGELGVAYLTVRRGLALLREQGAIITRHGRGSFVTPPGQPEPPPSPATPPEEPPP